MLFININYFNKVSSSQCRNVIILWYKTRYQTQGSSPLDTMPFTVPDFIAFNCRTVNGYRLKIFTDAEITFTYSRAI